MAFFGQHVRNAGCKTAAVRDGYHQLLCELKKDRNCMHALLASNCVVKSVPQSTKRSCCSLWQPSFEPKPDICVPCPSALASSSMSGPSNITGSEPEVKAILKAIGDMIEQRNESQNPNSKEEALRRREEEVQWREMEVTRREQSLRDREIEVRRLRQSLQEEHERSWEETRAPCTNCGMRPCSRSGPCFSYRGEDLHNGHHNCRECHREWKTWGVKGGFKGMGKFY